jgi:hypothetical protein
LNDYATLSAQIAVSRQIDTFLVIKNLVEKNPAGNNPFNTFIGSVIADNVLPEYKLTTAIKSYQVAGGVSVQTYFEDITGALLLKYGVTTVAPVTPAGLFTAYMAAIPAPPVVGAPPAPPSNPYNHHKLLDDYRRLKDFLLKEDKHYIEKKMYDAEIEVSKDLWTWKAIMWFNLTATGANANFRLYDEPSKLLLDTSSFLPGATLSINGLLKGKEVHSFGYVKIGFTISKSNSLVDLPKFNYAKETTITINPGETMKSKEEGVAYNGKLIEKKATEFFIETYILPWKPAGVPGLYAKVNWRHSDAWINPKKTAFDLGMVWSVINNDKDSKNLLTIIPFVSWSNLNDEYKDATKTEFKKKKDLFSAGIKIGVPINLSK